MVNFISETTFREWLDTIRAYSHTTIFYCDGWRHVCLTHKTTGEKSLIKCLVN